MATTIRLEKDGYMKDAFVGYSYTTAFFNAFVPAARQDLKSFLFMGGIYFFNKTLEYSSSFKGFQPSANIF